MRLVFAMSIGAVSALVVATDASRAEGCLPGMCLQRSNAFSRSPVVPKLQQPGQFMLKPRLSPGPSLGIGTNASPRLSSPGRGAGIPRGTSSSGSSPFASKVTTPKKPEPKTGFIPRVPPNQVGPVGPVPSPGQSNSSSHKPTARLPSIPSNPVGHVGTASPGSAMSLGAPHRGLGPIAPTGAVYSGAAAGSSSLSPPSPAPAVYVGPRSGGSAAPSNANQSGSAPPAHNAPRNAGSPTPTSANQPVPAPAPAAQAGAGAHIIVCRIDDVNFCAFPYASPVPSGTVCSCGQLQGFTQ
jgi:hypothetical protein